MASDMVFLGCSGNDVTIVQARINFHGFGVLAVDGEFGKNTDQAVIQFQMAQGLTADGIVGPNTWSELLNDFDAPLSGREEIEAIVRNKHISSIVTQTLLSEDVKNVISLAVSDLDKKEYPNGSNEGPEISHLVDGYHEYWKISKSEYPALPWCAMAVSRWIYLGLDLTSWDNHPFGAFYGGCSQIEDWAKKHGKYFTVKGEGAPSPGAIFLMPRAGSSSDPTSSAKAGHTGLVVSVEDDEIVTVEGNVQNKVSSKRRKLSELISYANWWE